MELQQEFAEGLRLFQEARFDEALTHFQQALMLGPNELGVVFDLAVTYANLSQNDNALEQLRTIINSGRQGTVRTTALELYYELREGTYSRQHSLAEDLAGL